MIAIMVNRTGALPVASGTSPIRAYQDLLRELDDALHGDATLDHACQLWNRCAVILRQLFLPPDLRHAELESLAATEPATEEDVSRLLSLIAGPNHLRHFLSRISSPAWLEALVESGILDPPAENDPWPVFRQSIALRRIMVRLSLTFWSAFTPDMEPIPLGRGSLPELPPTQKPRRCTLSFVLSATTAECRRSLLSEFGQSRKSISPENWSRSSPTPSSTRRRGAAHPTLDPVIESLLEGLDEANAARRLQLLCWKLRRVGNNEDSRRWFSYEPAGSIADWKRDGRNDRFTVLLHALVETVRRSQVWIPSVDLLTIVDSLPDDLRGRVRALVLAGDPDVDLSVVIDELAKSIADRDPTGDDLPLLDRVVAEGAPEDYATAWAHALGPAPAVVEVAQRLRGHELPAEWLRAFHWAGVLPEEAVGQWVQPVSPLCQHHVRHDPCSNG